MAVKVSFKVGNRKVSNAEMSEGIDQFIQAVGVKTVDQAATVDRVQVQALRAKLSGRVERSLEAAISFAANTMVGTKSNVATKGRGAPTTIHFDWSEPYNPIVNANARQVESLKTPDVIYWEALSRKTIMKKSNTQAHGAVAGRGESPRDRARQHFIHTGALQAELRQLAKNIVTKTGSVTVGYMKGNAKNFRSTKDLPKHIKVGKIQLAFLPKANLANLPGAHTAEASVYDPNVLFERSLGISKPSLRKLRGVEGHHRPLLQPIFTFWALNRIPRIVATTIQNSLK
jgi:hypothetical protein